MAEKLAIQRLVKGADGRTKVYHIDLETYLPLSNLTGYRVLSGGNLSDPDFQFERVQDVDAPDADLPEDEDEDETPRRRRAFEESGQDDESSTGSRNFDGPTNNFGYINKPRGMGLAGAIPGPAGLIGKGVNAVVNMNNARATNRGRETIGLKPKTGFAETLKSAFRDNKGQVADVDILGGQYSVGYETLSPQGRTNMTPEEARKRAAALGVEIEEIATRGAFANKPGIKGKVMGAVQTLKEAVGLPTRRTKAAAEAAKNPKTTISPEEKAAVVARSPGGLALARAKAVAESKFPGKMKDDFVGPSAPVKKGGGFADLVKSVGSPSDVPGITHNNPGRNPGGVFENATPNMRTSLSMVNAMNPQGIAVNSVYRDPQVNAAVGGTNVSEHMRGNAYDMDISGLTDTEKSKRVEQIRMTGPTRIGMYTGQDVLHVDFAEGYVDPKTGQPTSALARDYAVDVHPMYDKTIGLMGKAEQWFIDGLRQADIATTAAQAATPRPEYTPAPTPMGGYTPPGPLINTPMGGYTPPAPQGIVPMGGYTPPTPDRVYGGPDFRAMPGTETLSPDREMPTGPFSSRPDRLMPDGTYSSPPDRPMPSGPYSSPPDRLMPDGTYSSRPDRLMPDVPYSSRPDRQMPSGPYSSPPDRGMFAGPYSSPPDRQMPSGPYSSPPDRGMPSGPFSSPPDRQMPSGPFSSRPDRLMPSGPIREDRTPMGGYTPSGGGPLPTNAPIPTARAEPDKASKFGLSLPSAPSRVTTPSVLDGKIDMSVGAMTPAKAANLGLISRTPEENKRINEAILGEMTQKSLADLAKNDPAALREYANIASTVENRIGSRRYAGKALTSVLNPTDYNSLMKTANPINGNIPYDTTKVNVSRYGKVGLAALDQYQAGLIKPSSYDLTHYYGDYTTKTYKPPSWGADLTGKTKTNQHMFGSMMSAEPRYESSEAFRNQYASISPRLDTRDMGLTKNYSGTGYAFGGTTSSARYDSPSETSGIGRGSSLSTSRTTGSIGSGKSATSTPSSAVSGASRSTAGKVSGSGSIGSVGTGKSATSTSSSAVSGASRSTAGKTSTTASKTSSSTSLGKNSNGTSNGWGGRSGSV